MLVFTQKAMLAFITVFLSSAFWTQLPSALLLATCLLCLIFSAQQGYKLANALLVGSAISVLWGASVGYGYLFWQLPNQYLDKSVIIEGRVSSVHLAKSIDDAQVLQGLNSPKQTQTQVSFNLNITTIGQQALLFEPTVRLSWFAAKKLPQQGQRWRLLVKLKSPNGLANQHGFDYQQWLASKNIVATGYVKSSPSNELMPSTASTRQALVNRIATMPLQHLDMLLALSLGYRGIMEKDDWTLIQHTGTAHLFAISGLHLGIVSALAYRVGLLLACLFTLAKRNTREYKQPNLHRTACVLSFVAGLAYAYLAGFEVPVLRACIGLALFSYLLAWQRHWSLSHFTLCLLCVFLILFPLSILGLSFWFSFLALMSIWFILWLQKPTSAKTRLVQWRYRIVLGIKLQVGLSVLMLPVVAYSFAIIAPASVLFNLIAVPLVTLILVPLCLLAVCTLVLGADGLSMQIFQLADTLMGYLLSLLQLNEHLQGLIWALPALPISAWLLFGAACVLLLLPFWPHRKKLCLLLYLPLCSYAFSPVLPRVSVQVLDVGQGLALIIETPDNIVLYDAGAAYVSGFSMAQAAIQPYLAAHKRSAIDYLVLSHLDNDHAGGARWLQNNVDITRQFSPAKGCVAGQMIYLNSLSKETPSIPITLEVLWPLSPQTGHDNDHSCVIKLSGAGFSVLLTGDIEAKTEAELLRLYGERQGVTPASNKLRADVLIAPHHGSASSSTMAFLQQVKAKHVVFSAAHPNRWQFPDSQVLHRYQALGAKLWFTGVHGQISFYEEANTLQVRSYRQEIKVRWYNRPKAWLNTEQP